MAEVGIAVLYFTGIIVILAGVIVGSRAMLVATGEVDVVINDQRTVSLAIGKKLLVALADCGIYLPSACGGRGSCGQCRVKVLDGGGPLLPTEAGLISPRQIAEHERLACQVAVRRALRIRMPTELLGVAKHVCSTRSTRNIATHVKEIVLDLPPGETLDFHAGSYVQVECPPHDLAYADFEIEAEFRGEWDRLNLWRYKSHVNTTQVRAYSLANYPGEFSGIMLNVRIATPPVGEASSVPPGAVSSYLFNLKPGDEVAVTGPYGEASARQTDNEMVFVGGGAGMAPMRSLIFDELVRIGTTRKISFWYGARSLKELFYTDDFNRLQDEHENFEWHIALSEPTPDDAWQGATGFIHQVLFEEYLKDHHSPESCEYYLCGPPVMNAAVIRTLRDLGVDDDHITLDDFGVADAQRKKRTQKGGARA